jgi:hypothetical protein
MAPYVSVSERKAASVWTWTMLVAHVRAAEQCGEHEARRQIGNAIADRGLWPKWADRIIPRGTRNILSEDDAPPLEAIYWLECEVDPTCPDRVLEPPMYDPALVNARIAKRLDKRRRFRKPIFQPDHVLHLWPNTGRANDCKKEPLHEPKLTESALREEVDAQYKERITSFIKNHLRYPTREEDRAWGKGLRRIRINELRASFLPEKVRKGGRPKTLADAKLGKK